MQVAPLKSIDPTHQSSAEATEREGGAECVDLQCECQRIDQIAMAEGMREEANDGQSCECADDEP